MKVLVLLLLPVVVLSVKVGVFTSDPSLEDLAVEISKALSEAGYEAVDWKTVKEKLEGIHWKGSEDLKLILASKILGIDELFVLKREGDSVVVRRVYVKSGESAVFLKGHPGEIGDLFRKKFSRRTGETVRVSIEIGGWKEGAVYKRGDLVRYGGEIYRAISEHVAVEGNEPGRGWFWKRIGEKIILGYFPSWGIYTKGFRVSDVEAEKLTHLVYAFANLTEDGRCIVGDPNADMGLGEDGRCEKLGGNFADIVELKKRYPRLKVMISVGGWNWSENFSKVAGDPDLRKRFVDTCVKTFIMGDFGECGKYPGIFDGIDIDWEFPVSGGKYPGSPEDRVNFTKLLKELRAALDEAEGILGRHLLLSIAGGSDEDYIFKNTEMEKITKYVDFIIVMTYDFKGPWSERTGFHNALYPYDGEDLCADRVIENYLKAGVPRGKILLGIPLYGRSFSGVDDENSGVGRPFSGMGPGTVEGGVLDYRDVVNRFEKRLEKHFHPSAQVPWLYGDGIFVSYEDENSASVKALYVLENDLAGVALWELSSDAAGVKSILNALNAILRGDRGM